jgi:hypothetical protein
MIAQLPSIRSFARRVLLGMALLVAGLASPVQAQPASSEAPDATEPTEVRWQVHFEDQMAQQLRATTAGATRTTLLRTLIGVIAEEGEAVDGAAAVPALLRILEDDPSPQRRLLAAQALNLIVPERTDGVLYRNAIGRLSDLVADETAVPVRRALASMLKTYQAGAPAS